MSQSGSNHVPAGQLRQDQEKLCQAILQGDKQALRRLYRELEPKLRHYVQGRVSVTADAQEIIQDTLLAFLDALPLFAHRSSVWTFVRAIASHEIADYYRRQYAKRVIRALPLVNELYDEQLHASEQAAADLHQMIEAVYQKLAPQHRSVLRLKYEAGLSVIEIAQHLNLSPKAAESLLYRARTAFQKLYRQLHGEPDFALFPALTKA